MQLCGDQRNDLAELHCDLCLCGLLSQLVTPWGNGQRLNPNDLSDQPVSASMHVMDTHMLKDNKDMK